MDINTLHVAFIGNYSPERQVRATEEIRELFDCDVTVSIDKSDTMTIERFRSFLSEHIPAFLFVSSQFEFDLISANTYDLIMLLQRVETSNCMILLQAN